MQALDDVKIIFYDIKIYVQQSLRRSVLDWYHLYLNHTSGSRLAKKHPIGVLFERLCYASGDVC